MTLKLDDLKTKFNEFNSLLAKSQNQKLVCRNDYNQKYNIQLKLNIEELINDEIKISIDSVNVKEVMMDEIPRELESVSYIYKLEILQFNTVSSLIRLLLDAYHRVNSLNYDFDVEGLLIYY